MLENRELLKKSIMDLQVGDIEFRSYNGHSKAKGSGWRAEPVPSPTGNGYKGVDKITKEMRDSGEPFVDPLDPTNALNHVMISHGYRMDVSLPENKLILKWLVENDKLALSFVEGKGDPNKMYYIYDEILETAAVSRTFEAKSTTLDTVKNMPESMVSKYVRLLGYPVAGRTLGSLRNMLYVIADKTPDKIMEIMNDKRVEIKDYVLRLLQANIIHQVKNGPYMYNQTPLATTMEGLYLWFTEAQKSKKTEDHDLLIAMKAELDKK